MLRYERRRRHWAHSRSWTMARAHWEVTCRLLGYRRGTLILDLTRRYDPEGSEGFKLSIRVLVARQAKWLRRLEREL